MKKKEVGIPANAPAAVKKADEAMDKKYKVVEGSKEDLKKDKEIMRRYKAGKKLVY